MKFLHRLAICTAAIGLMSVSAVYAQVSSINSIRLYPREFNDVPGATLSTSISLGNPYNLTFNEQGVSAATGFANRDVWRFSNNGVSAFQFSNNDYFHVQMTLTLTGSPISPRKEAGFMLNSIGGDGQFIVNTDAHEVVAFGGPFPFYSFAGNGLSYNSGDTITLGMTYFLNPGTGLRSIIYSANGINSPILAFTDLEQGIIDGSRLGGYFQIVNDPLNPSNGGAATFGNISITAVPEPSSLALVGLAGLVVLFRRRRQ